MDKASLNETKQNSTKRHIKKEKEGCILLLIIHPIDRCEEPVMIR